MRVFICSPAITAEEPDKAENGFLQKMTDEGLALAMSLGAGAIDIQRGMREVQRRIVDANAREKDEKKQTRLHVEDGVHLNDLGQLAMAYAMLKGLGAPEEVSSATIDAGAGALVCAEGCAISEIAKRDNGIEFTRLDHGLPLNLGALSGLQYRWITIPDGINRYMLTVQNLAAGDYEIRAGDRSLGKTNAAHLARGLNISSMTADPWEPGGPWDAQSCMVKDLVEARDKLWMSDFFRARFASGHPQNADLEKRRRELDDELVAHQHAVAKPFGYRFEIRKVAK